MKSFASNLILAGCISLGFGLSALRESSLEQAFKRASTDAEILEAPGGLNQTVRLLQERAPRSSAAESKFLELRGQRLDSRNECLLLGGVFVLAGLGIHQLLNWAQKRRFTQAA